MKPVRIVYYLTPAKPDSVLSEHHRVGGSTIRKLNGARRAPYG